ncbi:TonB-dependent receptor plug domain-containing protein [Paremcibacter congregatus]|uniref:TonB-dependent receptor plug domain-containing protein n=1 Tax=Paremcibacter congregatus TaxID=2043170 RepID=UPI0013FD23A8|nr:TonB-dependent receptor plug domain-containing protein [Paremcibacter congregatus]
MLALLSSSMLITAGPANMVSAAEDDGAMVIEEVMVTGSRIKRTEQESTSPVVVLSGDDFRAIGSDNVEDMLNRLPQVTAGFNGTANNPADGTATVDLRGLGSNRTLVLVNGRRYLQSTQQGTVDLNNIPAALIQNVEIVTGGASAVYGSDAISGVVNFKIKDNFEGLEFRGEYGLSLF